MDYPSLLETTWLDHACQLTGTRSARTAVARLENAAGELSDAFTTGRDPAFSEYPSRPEALAAYGLFFFPRSFVRTGMVLHECRAAISLTEGSPIRIADLGAGTGAAGLAALAEYTRIQPAADLRIDMIDNAGDSLNLARMVFAAGKPLWPCAKLNTIESDARSIRLKGEYNLIICSFAINEWMETFPVEKLLRWTEAQLEYLAPGGLLVLMDPALRTSVERLVQLRDRVAANRVARIIAPCPHTAPCPMHAGRHGWCHEVRAWSVPPSMRLINRKLQRDIHLLKYSFLALARKAPDLAPAADWSRLVSPISPEKGKFTCHACGPDGNLHHYEWLSKTLSKEESKASERLSRGDRIKVTGTKILGDGKTERIDGPPSLR